MYRSHSGRKKRAFQVLTVLFVVLTLGLGSFFVSGLARADWDSSVGKGIEIQGVATSGVLRLGPHYPETASIDGVAVEDYPVWCIQAKLGDPGPNEMTSISTLTESRQLGPSELNLTTPQLAWLLNKYQGDTRDNTNLAALAYLLHINFEQEYRRPGTAQATVNELIAAVRDQAPGIETRALQYADEARNSAAIGYESGSVEGDGQRKGVIRGIAVTNEAGQMIAGEDIELTLIGPAVFDETGTNKWAGKSAATPLEKTWRSTGNGTVKFFSRVTHDVRTTLTKFGADGSIQDMITYGNRDPLADPAEVTEPGPTWRVIFDFQPTGVSQVDTRPVNLDGKISDTFTTSVDKSYGDGKWLDQTPVVYTARAYYVGRNAPATTDTVPAGAELLGEGQELRAEFTTPKTNLQLTTRYFKEN
ncbi:MULTISPECIES: hypothetical protein [Actinotignum]|uniref:Uncharacterized protein n=1 Tax=Actinotignum timonense TaxID=1870995 RepID=A0AAW9HHW3_9ACTO|nr:MULTISPECIES: hypothetical protein [Actinotignum]MBS5748981.1 hypothetical protein [Actinotignum schaalii]MDE1557970.1 hypothetical protein [Actinotignum schaalii]MDE1663289.1 hypothetical protein [Actinotignum schaalii]MDK6373182.1 hypothetical protein [Actinotignum timonense]MDK6419768.1 hypothetical protein [Actinotignum timonense]